MSRPRGFIAWLRRDSAEAVFFLRTLFYVWPITTVGGVFLAYFLFEKQRVDFLGFSILAAASVPFGLAMALGTWWMLGTGSRGFVQMLFSAGNIPPAAAFSLEESLIARGELEQARQVLEDRLAGGSETVAIQLRLADLHARLRRDPAEAERWYQAARRGPATDQQRWEATNGLVDLYRAHGPPGRLMAELARLAATWPATRAAADARAELQRLKSGPS